MTVISLGSVGGSCAKQSPTCRSIHFSVRAIRVGGGTPAAVGVLGGVMAAMVEVGFVDVRPDFGLFAAQPDSTVSSASDAAKQLTAGKPRRMARVETCALINECLRQ